jgi:hypothetical protein
LQYAGLMSRARNGVRARAGSAYLWGGEGVRRMQ